MTLQNLLVNFESYYGERYNPVMLKVMTNYLEKHPESFYDAVFQVVVKNYSRTFNKSPCPAEIEKNLDEIYTTMDAKQILLPVPKQEITEEERQHNVDFMNKLLYSLSQKTKQAVNYDA